MKVLVIGIDGGDAKIFTGMPMSFMHGLLKSGMSFPVEEDLWSRGWAAVLSGLHGRYTGGFYERPRLDGTRRFTQSFRSPEYDKVGVQPLWRALEEKGHRVGFMNVPTTMPAPRISEGFFVAGAGGGLGQLGAGRVPTAAGVPVSVAGELEAHGYVMDLRVRASGIRDAMVLLDRLGEMQARRTKAFLSLCENHRPDVAFLAYMATSRLQNLAMSEIEPMISGEMATPSRFQRGVTRLYGGLDDDIRLVVETLQPRHVVLVSDHGAVPYRHSMNVDPFLREIDLQTPAGQVRETATGALKGLARRLVPEAGRNWLSHRLPTIVRRRFAGDPWIEWTSTLAFGHRYVSGIYLNDSKRFDGPVGSDAEGRDLVRLIVREFNQHPDARALHLRARPYRSEYSDAPFSALLPDVWIDKPDTIFPEGEGQFVQENPHYGPLPALGEVHRDMFTGVKGRHPLLVIDREASEKLYDLSVDDLTTAYRAILQISTR